MKKGTQKILQVCLILSLTFGFVVPVSADHSPLWDEANAELDGTRENLDPILDPTSQCFRLDDSERIDPTGGSGSSGSGSSEVPVYDNDVNSNLVTLIDIIQNNEEIDSWNELENSRMRVLMQILCEKEFQEDHKLQHAWADLIGEFVEETYIFLQSGYGGNPAFLTSQEAYYQLVNIGVARVFMQNIVDSNMGAETRREIISTVASNLYGSKFPYVGPELAPDDIPEAQSAGETGDADAFWTGGGWAAYNALTLNKEQNSGNVKRLALQELGLRIAKQQDYEKEKLAWGRGFFSNEICDLQIYGGALADEDRRNCRIAAPGSLIQDQMSFVFGTALRQMEINDEWEEWVSLFAFEALSDTVSYRGVAYDDTGARGGGPIPDSRTDANSPTELAGVDIRGTEHTDPIPEEFTRWIDVELWSLGGSIDSDTSLGDILYGDVLNPDEFLSQIP